MDAAERWLLRTGGDGDSGCTCCYVDLSLLGAVSLIRCLVFTRTGGLFTFSQTGIA